MRRGGWRAENNMVKQELSIPEGVFDISRFQIEGRPLFEENHQGQIKKTDIDFKMTDRIFREIVRVIPVKEREFQGVYGCIKLIHVPGTSFLTIILENTFGGEREMKWTPHEFRPSDRMDAVEVVQGKQMFNWRSFDGRGQLSQVRFQGDVVENSIALDLGYGENIKITYS